VGSNSVKGPCTSLIGVSETCVSLALGDVVTVEKSCDADAVLVKCDRMQLGDVASMRPGSVEDRVFIMREGSQHFFAFFTETFRMYLPWWQEFALVLRSFFVLSSSFSQIRYFKP